MDFTSLCYENLIISLSNSKSIFMACDPDDGSPVIVSYGYTRDGRLLPTQMLMEPLCHGRSSSSMFF